SRLSNRFTLLRLGRNGVHGDIRQIKQNRVDIESDSFRSRTPRKTRFDDRASFSEHSVTALAALCSHTIRHLHLAQGLARRGMIQPPLAQPTPNEEQSVTC